MLKQLLAHHVLWAMGTFVTLWAISLIARGVLHRPRVRNAKGAWVRGPREVKLPVVWSGAAVLPVGIGVCVAADRVHLSLYGRGMEEGFTAYHAVAIGIGAFAASLTVWGLFADRSRDRKRCGRCWYDMEAVAESGSLICPECGLDAGTEAGLHRTRRRWGVVWIAAGLLVVAMVTPRGAGVERGGVKALIPTTVMVMNVWRLPEAWVWGTNFDDRWTLDERMKPRVVWEWQRRWLKEIVDAELAAPTSMERVARAMRMSRQGPIAMKPNPTAALLRFAIGVLAHGEDRERQAAAEVLDWVSPHQQAERGSLERAKVTGIWELATSEAEVKGTVAESHERLLERLQDGVAGVSYHAAGLLVMSGRDEEKVLEWLLREYGNDRYAARLSGMTRLMLMVGAENAEVSAAVLEMTKRGSRASAVVWAQVEAWGREGKTPEALLTRADEIVLGTMTDTEGPALVAASRIRLGGKHMSAALVEEMVARAGREGRGRARAVTALSWVRAEDGRDQRAWLIERAMGDMDAAVVRAAVEWVRKRTEERAQGYEMALPQLERLSWHFDEEVRGLAEMAATEIVVSMESDGRR